MARAVAVEVGDPNIRISDVCPGIIATPMGQSDKMMRQNKHLELL